MRERTPDYAPNYPYYPLKRRLWIAVYKRDGELCSNCKKAKGVFLHEIYEHRPFNYYAAHLEELRLFCVGCNSSVKVKPLKRCDTSVRERESPMHVEGQSDITGEMASVVSGSQEIYINQRWHDWFRDWVIMRARDGYTEAGGRPLTVYDALYSVCEAAKQEDPEGHGFSPVTARRWLRMMLSPEGDIRLGRGPRGYQILVYHPHQKVESEA